MKREQVGTKKNKRTSVSVRKLREEFCTGSNYKPENECGKSAKEMGTFVVERLHQRTQTSGGKDVETRSKRALVSTLVFKTRRPPRRKTTLETASKQRRNGRQNGCRNKALKSPNAHHSPVLTYLHGQRHVSPNVNIAGINLDFSRSLDSNVARVL